MRDVQQYFLVPLYGCKKKRAFVKAWIEVLKSFAREPGFEKFYPNLPVLPRIHKRPKGVLIVASHDARPVGLGFAAVTLFPLSPFKACYESEVVHCTRETILRLLSLYLEVTGVKTVGFYKIARYQVVRKALLENDATLVVYPPSLFKFFRNKVR